MGQDKAKIVPKECQDGSKLGQDEAQIGQEGPHGRHLLEQNKCGVSWVQDRAKTKPKIGTEWVQDGA